MRSDSPLQKDLYSENFLSELVDLKRRVADLERGSLSANAAAAQYLTLDSVPQIEAARLISGANVLENALLTAADVTHRYVTLEYVDASTRYVWLPIKQIHWLRVQLDLLASGAWTTGEMRVYQVLMATNDTDSGITYGGTGAWLTQTGGAAAGAVGDSRHYGYNDDHYLEFTVSGTDALWVAFQKTTLSGYVKPLIDGSQDLTRQHMTDVVGSDYVFNTYGVSVPASVQKIADNLDPSRTYTVRLELLPVVTIPPGSTDNRFYFEAYIKAPTRYDEAVQISNTTKRLETPIDADSGWVLSYIPAGAAGTELAGSRHLNESAAAAVFVDAQGTALDVDATNTMVTASAVVLLQSSYLRHSETSTTNHAAVRKAHLFSQGGIRTTLNIEWLNAATVNYVYYGMLPAALDSLLIAGYPTQYSLTNNNNLRYGQKRAVAAAMWDSGHPYAFLYRFDDPAMVNNLGASGFIEYLDAVVDGGKLYPKLINDVTYVSSGDVWQAAYSWRPFEVDRLADVL